MDSVVVLDLPRLVDLSIGVPTVGNVNSTLLHTLLHVMVRKLGMEDYRVELSSSSGSQQVKELLPYLERAPTLVVKEYQIKGRADREIVPVRKSETVKSVFVIDSKKRSSSSERRRDNPRDSGDGQSRSSNNRGDRNLCYNADDEGKRLGARRKESSGSSRPRSAGESARDNLTNTTNMDLPRPLSDAQLRALEHVEQQHKIQEMSNWGVRDSRRREKDTCRRSKSYDRHEDIRKLEEAVSDINVAIADVLPQLVESELSKFKDLKSRVDSLERQVKNLGRFVGYAESHSQPSSRSSSLKATPGTTSAPGFIAKEQVDLLMEGILRDKDGRLMSRIEDKIKGIINNDLQTQLMQDLSERMKGELNKSSNDIVNTRIQQIEHDLLKAMKDMEEMLNKCQGDELKQMLDTHMSKVMERLNKVERAARLRAASTNSCELCPETLTCCTNLMSQSGKTTPDSTRGTVNDFPTRPITPRRPHSTSSASLKSNKDREKEKTPTKHRKLSQKSKSEIEFTPSFCSKSYTEEPFRIRKKSLENLDKPIPPAKTGRMVGGYMGSSTTTPREKYGAPIRQNSEPECSYCIDLENEQKAKSLPRMQTTSFKYQ
uniref:CSON014755 protein n=1 Tax=Culicoides sonorensis TaxID=179676 RepID=A0A336MP78_CULSO